jgi:hypothetical protein
MLVPAHGTFVDFVELNAPLRNCEPVDDSEPVDETKVARMAEGDLPAVDAEAVKAPSNCVVPGLAGFAAAEASRATTPSRTVDATRSVKS